MTKIPLLIFTVLYLSILSFIYIEYSRLLLVHQIKEQSESIAYLVDSMESCHSYCVLEYTLPREIKGESYLVNISGERITVEAGRFKANTILMSSVANSIELSGGKTFRIIKSSADSQIRLKVV